MVNINFDVAGAKVAALRFEQFPETARKEFHAAIDEITKELLERALAAVPRDTGKLASQITQYVFDAKDAVVGVVAVVAPKGDVNAIKKALSEEYGARADAFVKAHTSTLDHIFSRMIQPRTVMVEAFTRPTRIVAQAYMRPSLDAIRSSAIERLHEALEKAVAEDNGGSD